MSKLTEKWMQNFGHAIALDYVAPFRPIQESLAVEKRAVIAPGITPLEHGPVSDQEKKAEYIRRHGAIGEAMFEEDQKFLKSLESNASTRLSEAAESQTKK